MFVEYETVWVVVHHDYSVTPRKVNQTFIGLPSGICPGRHVRVIAPKQPDTIEVHVFQFFKIGLPAVVGSEIVIHHLRPKQFAERSICGVTGIGHEHFFARVDESKCNMQYSLFRAYERLYLARRVEVHIEPAFVPFCHCSAQFGRTYRRLVAVCVGKFGHPAQFVDSSLRGRHVGAAYRKTYYIFAFCVEPRYFFSFAAKVIFVYRLQTVGRAEAFCGIVIVLTHILQVFSIR